MVPWFSQPKFGLPSKVCLLFFFASLRLMRRCRNITKTRLSGRYTRMSSRDYSWQLLKRKKKMYRKVLQFLSTTTMIPFGPPGLGRRGEMTMTTMATRAMIKEAIEVTKSKYLPRKLWLLKESWLRRVWTCGLIISLFCFLFTQYSRDILYQDPIATYNPVSISNLTDSLPQLDFATYFSTFTPRTFPDRVILTDPTYASSLSKILDDTASEVVEAYLTVRAALALSPYLGMTTEAWQVQRSLVETLTGIKKGAVGDRAEYCIGKVEETLGFAAGRYFVNETFRGDSREKGTKVISGSLCCFSHFFVDVYQPRRYRRSFQNLSSAH